MRGFLFKNTCLYRLLLYIIVQNVWKLFGKMFGNLKHSNHGKFKIGYFDK